MPSTARLQQTDHAADSATETPSGTHRGFFPHRKDRQIPFRGLSQARGSTESLRPRFLPRACFLADLRPHSSANKEQRPRIWESKNFTNKRSRSAMIPVWLLQKQIHAVEVNDGMIVVQRIDPEDTADSCVALLQREIR